MKTFLQKYKHAFVLLYALIYLPWFCWLESRANQPYHVIYIGLDDKIPFIEYFIIPYLLWFVYVAVVFLYMFFQDRKEFYQYCLFLFTGMTLFLIVSTVYPNGHLLRPSEFERENLFTLAVQLLYQADTATNIFPSIHVYNSIAVHFAIIYNEKLKKKKWICNTSAVLMISIVLSTVFLKQHSVFDVMTAFIMAAAVYIMVYRTELLSNLRHTYEKYRKRKETQWF